MTALSALTMPVPHSPEAGQEHSSLLESTLGQTGRLLVLAGNAVALDSRRFTSSAGVRLPFTERMRPAMPDTMGAEKLVPRFVFVWLV